MKVEYDFPCFRPYVIRVKNETEHEHLHVLLDTAKKHQLSHTAETFSFIEELHDWINRPLEPETRT